MDKETKSPLDLVTELLAVMTARAVEAERQRIGEHQETRRQLREALNNQEGDQDHGKGNH